MNQLLRYVTKIDIKNYLDLIFTLILIPLVKVIFINLILVVVLIAFYICCWEVRIFSTRLLFINLPLWEVIVIIYERNKRLWVIVIVIIYERNKRLWVIVIVIIYERNKRLWVIVIVIIYERNKRLWVIRDYG